MYAVNNISLISKINRILFFVPRHSNTNTINVHFLNSLLCVKIDMHIIYFSYMSFNHITTKYVFIARKALYLLVERATNDQSPCIILGAVFEKSLWVECRVVEWQLLAWTFVETLECRFEAQLSDKAWQKLKAFSHLKLKMSIGQYACMCLALNLKPISLKYEKSGLAVFQLLFTKLNRFCLIYHFWRIEKANNNDNWMSNKQIFNGKL